jgi:hypothetical protein
MPVPLDDQDLTPPQEPQDQRDHQDHQEKPVPQDHQESQEPQLKMKPSVQESQESQEMPDHRDHPDHQEKAARMELLDHQDPRDQRDHKDHQEPMDSQDHRDHQDLQEIRARRERAPSTALSTAVSSSRTEQDVKLVTSLSPLSLIFAHNIDPESHPLKIDLSTNNDIITNRNNLNQLIHSTILQLAILMVQLPNYNSLQHLPVSH